MYFSEHIYYFAFLFSVCPALLTIPKPIFSLLKKRNGGWGATVTTALHPLAEVQLAACLAMLGSTSLG